MSGGGVTLLTVAIKAQSTKSKRRALGVPRQGISSSFSPSTGLSILGRQVSVLNYEPLLGEQRRLGKGNSVLSNSGRKLCFSRSPVAPLSSCSKSPCLTTMNLFYRRAFQTSDSEFMCISWSMPVHVCWNTCSVHALTNLGGAAGSIPGPGIAQ